VATGGQTLFAQRKMTFRRRRYMNNIRTGFIEQPGQIAEMPFDAKALAELLRHEFFPVTGSDDLTS
jgi:hypothetical protein